MTQNDGLEMKKQHRTIFLIATLALVLMYFLPIWKISLDAPQYPEGIGLYIWINNVSGEKKHDLGNINNLNHYIGMKTIQPDAIPELVYMPWIIGFMIALGLLAYWLNKPWLFYTWTLLFILIALIGLYDFYLWGYDYGHNLDEEHAIIKIPGMAYQPPLIGTKQILNFTATSLPSWGGIIAIFSILAGVFLSIKTWLNNRKELVLASVFLVGLLGCNPAPEAIQYEQDQCRYCKMQISDNRYGSEVVTSKGKTYKFDSLECMGHFVKEEHVPPSEIHSLWATDFEHPGALINLDDLFVLQSENLPSPMGMNLTAFGKEITQDAVLNAFAGKIITWEEVLEKIE